jgi:hypothetical protein
LDARNEYETYGSLLDATIAIFFFGTPHHGLRTEELNQMVKDVIEDKKHMSKLLDNLSEGSEFLENQGNAFMRLLEKRRVINFYETRKTQTPKKVGICIPHSLICLYPESTKRRVPGDDTGTTTYPLLHLQPRYRYRERFVSPWQQSTRISSSSLPLLIQPTYPCALNSRDA